LLERTQLGGRGRERQVHDRPVAVELDDAAVPSECRTAASDAPRDRDKDAKAVVEVLVEAAQREPWLTAVEQLAVHDESTGTLPLGAVRLDDPWQACAPRAQFVEDVIGVPQAPEAGRGRHGAPKALESSPEKMHAPESAGETSRLHP
jgi:hypothetical protein